MNPQQSARFVHNLVNGDAAATQFIADILNVMAFWDQLTYGTANGPQADAALWAAVVDMPRNAFYRAHFEQLHPLVVGAVLGWKTARAMEASDTANDKELSVAFIARQAWVEILVQACYITQGAQRAAAMGPEIRLFAHGGGFAEYLAELRKRTENTPQPGGEPKP